MWVSWMPGRETHHQAGEQDGRPVAQAWPAGEPESQTGAQAGPARGQGSRAGAQTERFDGQFGRAGGQDGRLFGRTQNPIPNRPPAFRRPTAAPRCGRRNLLRFLRSAPPAARVFRPGFHRPFPRTRKKYLKIANYPLLFSEKFFILSSMGTITTIIASQVGLLVTLFYFIWRSDKRSEVKCSLEILRAAYMFPGG